MGNNWLAIYSLSVDIMELQVRLTSLIMINYICALLLSVTLGVTFPLWSWVGCLSPLRPNIPGICKSGKLTVSSSDLGARGEDGGWQPGWPLCWWQQEDSSEASVGLVTAQVRFIPVSVTFMCCVGRWRWKMCRLWSIGGMHHQLSAAKHSPDQVHSDP